MPTSSESPTPSPAESPVPDDGRDRWWVIPAAVLGVLGAAAAAIVQARHRRKEEPVLTSQRIAPSLSTPPLAPLPDEDPTTTSDTPR